MKHVYAGSKKARSKLNFRTGLLLLLAKHKQIIHLLASNNINNNSNDRFKPNMAC
ncbi:hypothetical protein [Liquorilactobacillus mali]|uniref:hypothetical protein n=1 Tax=Liquorilactobacillus mali TaxID=1618 RepID=UPI000A858C21|nr:hypothetical protein [Liquorilactobacillus mali]MDC7953509.1 hypothetical protein [Liquorilactobacillus mali]